jgi:hypothetical protein
MLKEDLNPFNNPPESGVGVSAIGKEGGLGQKKITFNLFRGCTC